MAVNKNRNLQFLRNNTLVAVLSHNDAVTEAQAKFNTLPMVDGEIALYRYQIGTNVEGNIVADTNAPIHTIVGVAHVDGEVKNIEIIANYDHLTNIINGLDATVRVTSDGTVSTDGEVTVTGHTGAYVAVEIDEVDGKLTGIKVKENIDNTIAARISEAVDSLDVDNVVVAKQENNVVTIYNVKEENGKIAQNGEAVVLEEVAFTGAAADVAVADTEGIITAATVEGALAEIATEIDEMDSSLLTTHESQASKLIKLGYTQEDGVITSLTSDESALETRLQNIENNTITGKEAIVVTSDTTGNNEVSLKIANDEKVLSQSTAGLTSTLNLTYDSTAKAIKLWGISNETPIATVDATNFIKDGMLSDATIVAGTWEGNVFTESESGADKAIKFVWKTYQQGQTGEEVLKTEYLNVESLIDAYEAGNEWIVFSDTANTISHKLSTVIPTAEEGQEQATSKTVGNATATIVDNAGETVTFKVPTITVDRAGHVTAASDAEITITLPSYIGTAVQTITGEDTVLNNSEYVNVKAEKTATNEGAVEYTLTSTVKTQAVATAAAADGETPAVDGLATALDVKQFVLTNSASVVETEGETTVEKSTTQPYVYTVGLADVPQTDDNTATSSFDDENNTFTFVKAVNVDDKGRVTGIVTETVTENFDMGMYD